MRSLVVIALLARSVRAEVVVDGCPDTAEILRAIRVELADDDLDATIRCDGARAMLTLDGRSRIVAETDGPRLIALALAELAAEPITLPVVVRMPEPIQPLRPMQAMLLAGGLAFTRDPQPVASLGARVSRGSAMLDLQLHHGTRVVPAGDVGSDALSLGAAAMVRANLGAVEVAGGIGLRGGWVRFAGHESAPMLHGHVLWGPWFGPIVTGEASIPMTSQLSIAAGVEGGYVVVPVVALSGERTVGAIAGGWLAVHLGLAYRP